MADPVAASFLLESMIWPAFGLVLYTLLFLGYMTNIRVSKSAKREVKLEYFITKTTHAPREIILLNNHFINLFETPLLFYFLCIVYEIKELTTQSSVIVGWVFVFFRILHTFFHVSGEKKLILYRMGVFAITIVILVYLLFHAAFDLARPHFE